MPTTKQTKQEQPVGAMRKAMKKIVVRRTAPIKVTSAPLNHQPIHH